MKSFLKEFDYDKKKSASPPGSKVASQTDRFKALSHLFLSCLLLALPNSPINVLESRDSLHRVLPLVNFVEYPIPNVPVLEEVLSPFAQLAYLRTRSLLDLTRPAIIASTSSSFFAGSSSCPDNSFIFSFLFIYA